MRRLRQDDGFGRSGFQVDAVDPQMGEGDPRFIYRDVAVAFEVQDTSVRDQS